MPRPLKIPICGLFLWILTIPSHLGLKHWTVTTFPVSTCHEGDSPKHCEWHHPFSLWEGQVVAWNRPIQEAGNGHFCRWCSMTIGWIITLVPFTGTREKKNDWLEKERFKKLKIVREVILLSELKINIPLKFLVRFMCQTQCLIYFMQKNTIKEE